MAKWRSIVGGIVCSFLLPWQVAALEKPENAPRDLHKDLYQYALDLCEIPQSTSPIITVYIEWYVMQVWYPEMKKLFASMHTGVTYRKSALSANVVCIGRFMDLPKSPEWEGYLDLDKKATQMNAQPPVLLDEAFVDGSFSVKPNPSFIAQKQML